ncbi:MAG: nrdR [Candidatus Saganbacteria bacterium]|uniref:Transcriptional repressor NrdR n=1 Tax=Candidatus Saganbacteria bacterium TaxID=2575572 RepID=A0A833L261_UNCSA|nr:MAG: nrdR [Candidatus Saganbacteria bacterium]
MKCPACAKDNDKVLDSRPTDDGLAIRRRRECVECGNRFTSYERVEEKPLLIVKRDLRHEEFNRDKVLAGLVRACEKRPIELEVIEGIVDEVEKFVRRSTEEVKTSQIGELVMELLQKIDQVSYVRFASVYKQFKDVTDFVQVVREVSQ